MTKHYKKWRMQGIGYIGRHENTKTRHTRQDKTKYTRQREKRQKTKTKINDKEIEKNRGEDKDGDKDTDHDRDKDKGRDKDNAETKTKAQTRHLQMRFLVDAYHPLSKQRVLDFVFRVRVKYKVKARLG
jgi:hypothetical protein